MPQAAFADSTTAPLDHHSYSKALDDLEDVHMMLTTLVTSACLMMEDGNGTKEYAAGFSELSRGAFQRLNHARTTFVQFRPQAETAIKPDDPWVKLKVFWRVVEVMKAVRVENGEPIYDADEDWPRPLYDEVKTRALSYVDKLGAKVRDWNDALEVGTHLPWLDSVIREELLHADKPEPLTAMEGLSAMRGRTSPTRTIRDQFIAQAHAEGFSSADISMALGLRQKAVERTIRRLTSTAATQTEDHDEARTG